MQHLGVLQIDAVNAIARSHLLVLRSRIGGTHDSVRDLLERSAYRARDLHEYWCHEACFVPAEDWHLFRWRMDRAARGEMYKSMAEFGRRRADFIDQIEAHLREEGQATAGALEPGARKGPWWGWSDTKTALEWLFWTGRVTVGRRDNFTRHYDLTERIVDPDHLDLGLTEPQAHRELLLRAARHLGVGAADDLIDYFRLPKRDARSRIGELVAEGALLEATVEGWDRPGLVLPDAPRPRRRSRSTLLSPFDPIVWFRPRAERLFDFHYRIEIYVPAPKRQYGYYVLPFLHDDELRARVDLKADRADGTLRVHGAFGEPGRMDPEATMALSDELHDLARFCGLTRVAFGDRGELIDDLRIVAESSGDSE